MLINAVYFKAPWDEPFEKKNNFKDYFNSVEGDEKTVEYMNDFFYSGYCKNDKFEITGKDYGKSGKYGFYVVLPRKGVSPEDCLAELKADIRDN